VTVIVTPTSRLSRGRVAAVEGIGRARETWDDLLLLIDFVTVILYTIFSGVNGVIKCVTYFL